MPLPKISMVTPSYNQAQFLESAILSILEQKYPDLEYVIIDGGSDDGSFDIIRKYDEYLKFWVSEPDNGLYEALNKGFSQTSGEIMGWINSDDQHTPWTLSVVAEIFNAFPEVEWLTTLYPLSWDERGRATGCLYAGGFNRKTFFRGANLMMRKWYSRIWIQQESTFWRRSLWEKTGGCMDGSLKIAGDFELWTRFFKHADLYGVASPLAGFRKHSLQMVANILEEYLRVAERALFRAGGRPYGRIESILRHFLNRCLGGSPLRTLPWCLKEPLRLSGLISEVPIILWGARGWEISTEFII